MKRSTILSREPRFLEAVGRLFRVQGTWPGNFEENLRATVTTADLTRPENLWLARVPRFTWAVPIPGGAGVVAAARLRNPAGSGIMAVVRRILFNNATGGVTVFGWELNTSGDFATPQQSFQPDSRQPQGGLGPTEGLSGCRLSSGTSGAGPNFWRIQAGGNVTHIYEEPVVLMPGVTLELRCAAVNLTMGYGLDWDEYPASAQTR